MAREEPAMAAKTAEPKRYVVTGEYATMTTGTPQGLRHVGLYRGAGVPPDVPAHQIEHLLKMRLIGVEGEDAPATADEAQQVASQLVYAKSLVQQADEAIAVQAKIRDDAQAAVARLEGEAREQAKVTADSRAAEATAAREAAVAREAAAAAAAAEAEERRLAAEAEVRARDAAAKTGKQGSGTRGSTGGR
jgi:hypothetical protein